VFTPHEFSGLDPLQRSLELKLELYGPEHLEVARVLNNIGSVQEDLSLFEKAERSYLDALQIYEARWDGPHSDVARVLGNLAELYDDDGIGGQERALALRERQVAISEKVYPENHPLLSLHMVNLAGQYRTRERSEDAEPLYRRALEIRLSHHEPTHPDVIYVKSRLGRLLLDMKRYSEALPFLVDTVAAREASPLYETIKSRTLALENLAEAYDALGEGSKAKEVRLRVMELKESEAP
jgi:tetratricopeptide (TPR) repeat protein